MEGTAVYQKAQQAVVRTDAAAVGYGGVLNCLDFAGGSPWI